MEIIDIKNLYGYNYSLDVINALRQFWKSDKVFNCINNPKKCNMLLYLEGCNAEYTLKNEKKLYAKSGNIVYLPIGIEYILRYTTFEKRE